MEVGDILNNRYGHNGRHTRGPELKVSCDSQPFRRFETALKVGMSPTSLVSVRACAIASLKND